MTGHGDGDGMVAGCSCNCDSSRGKLWRARQGKVGIWWDDALGG